MNKEISSTEVKLLLDSKIALKEGFKLSEDIKDSLNIKEKGANMKIWYLDTSRQTLYQEGLLIRFRYHEDCDFELTFKKRFSEDDFAAVTQKEMDELSGFKPEIDFDLSKKTYSFSFIRLFPVTDSLFRLQLATARRLASGACPLVFCKRLNSPDNILDDTVFFGPVSAMEYKGSCCGCELSIEVWELGGYITEVSFKTETSKSEELLSDILHKLEKGNKKRLVLREGTLKTKALFDFYSNGATL